MSVRIEPLSLLRLVQDWEPPKRPHCSNCRYARIRGAPERPDVYCAMGRGRPRDLWQLIRKQSPSGFMSAEKCPDFDSMGAPT